MQTIGDGTAQRYGDIPKRHPDTRDIPLIENLLGRVGADLEPLRMEPPLAAEGLRPVAFTDGLDELSVSAIRSNGGRVHTKHSIGTSKMLEAAARRATALSLE